MLGRHLGEPLGSSIESDDHFRSGSLLGRKHIGGTVVATEGIGNIGGNGEVDIVKGANVIPRAVLCKAVDDGAEHTDTAVACSAAAKSNDDMPTTSAHGIHNKLPRAVARSSHRVTLLQRKQCQSAGLGHFDDGRLALYQIRCNDGA